MKKKVCIVTGTRAEYGLLRPLINKLKIDNELQLYLIATGMHLSPEFGYTYKEIEKDGNTIDEKIEILLSSDTTIGISKSMGLAIISFSECFERIKPDLLIVLGDRYETFSAVSAATVSKIPVAHIHGGETTEGAFDESFRHCITKMSQIHFTSTEEYRRRVIQLGEEPLMVFNVGAVGIESIKELELLSKESLESEIDFKFGDRNALITFHPVTLEEDTAEMQFNNLLNAIDRFENLKIIFTKSNSDTNGRIINKLIDDYVLSHKLKSKAFSSLGQLRYLSTLKIVDVVIGNSSSGIIEAPIFCVPTVNIGDRQKGRIHVESIINCKPETYEIYESIKKALSKEFHDNIEGLINPYGDGNVTEKIIYNIKENLNQGINLKKVFYDIKGI